MTPSGGSDTYLRCTVCGRTSTTNFASSLRTGWEKCCGYTMRLERTDADIPAAANKVLAEQGAVHPAAVLIRGRDVA